MPNYQWGEPEHKAWVKYCSNPRCPDPLFIGTEDEKESVEIFGHYFSKAVRPTEYGDNFSSRCIFCRAASISRRPLAPVRMMLEEQDEKCALESCRKRLMLQTGIRGYAVDHCTHRNMIRGLTCQVCNSQHVRIADGILKAAREFELSCEIAKSIIKNVFQYTPKVDTVIDFAMHGFPYSQDIYDRIERANAPRSVKEIRGTTFKNWGWIAQIRKGNFKRYSQQFETEEEAHKAYLEFEAEYQALHEDS